MAKKETVILTNMCLVYNNDQILVQKRTKDSWPGITFPGGHIEENESFVESTIREIKEETGLDIKNLEFCGVSHWTKLCGCRYIVFLYKTNCFSGTLTSSNEGEVFWINKNDLFKYELAEDLLEMFEVISSPNISEFFSLRDNQEKELTRKLL